MKRLSFSSLIVIVLSFIIVHSCSTEEDDTIAPNVVQTPEPEPSAPTQYSLTVTAGEGGTVSTEGGTYDEGTDVTIIATPSEGYLFTGWEGNDSTSESLTITLNSNQTFQALFELIPPVQYTLTVTAGEGGTVSTDGGTYDEGTIVTITAIPSEGYSLLEWTTPDGSRWGGSDGNSLNVTMNGNQTFQASFSVNLLAAIDISSLEHIESSEGFKFYYNISNNLPEDWIEEFKSIMNYLNEVIPVKPRISFSARDGQSEMHIFSWISTEESPYKDIIGDNSGACICTNEYGRYMLLEINNNDFIYNHTAGKFLVIAHEYFHSFQLNASAGDLVNGPTFLKFLMEGGATTLAALYSQQFYNKNDFLNNRTKVTNNAINSPHLFEEYGEPENNYSDSVFIFLALVKELQKRNNISEIEALKKVLVEYWKSDREGATRELLFEEVFGFSLNSFYESLKSYTPDINTVLPSENIRLEEIFEEL
jgi:hypothetical protein